MKGKRRLGILLLLSVLMTPSPWLLIRASAQTCQEQCDANILNVCSNAIANNYILCLQNAQYGVENCYYNANLEYQEQMWYVCNWGNAPPDCAMMAGWLLDYRKEQCDNAKSNEEQMCQTSRDSEVQACATSLANCYLSCPP